MPDNEATLVARIKTLYEQRRKDKLVMQQDMATLRDQFGWTQLRIAGKTGVPQPTVSRWLSAYDQGIMHMHNPALTPPDHRAQSDLAVAKRVFAQATPEQVRDILDQPGALSKVAAAASHLAPKKVDMRTEAEKQADEAEAAQFEDDMRILINSPRKHIQEATEDMRRLIRNDREMKGGDEEYELCLEAENELRGEMWVYGAQRGHDVSRLMQPMPGWEGE